MGHGLSHPAFPATDFAAGDSSLVWPGSMFDDLPACTVAGGAFDFDVVGQALSERGGPPERLGENPVARAAQLQFDRAVVGICSVNLFGGLSDNGRAMAAQASNDLNLTTQP